MGILDDFRGDNVGAFFMIDPSIFRLKRIEMLSINGEGLPFVVNGRKHRYRDQWLI
jgi:hypothetical protein